MATSVATMNKMTTGGNFCKKVCKSLSHIVMYIIEGAISAEIAVFLKICYDTFK